MNTRDFFARIWAQTGWHCLALLGKNGNGMRHYWYDFHEAAVIACEKFVYHGETVYHGCANFIERGSRKASNVQSANSIWIDIDVGEDPSKYPSQRDGMIALKSFLTRHRFPVPMLINSGGGLHAYFTFDEAIPKSIIQPVAAGIKALAIAEGFKIDHTRTADLSSVLRPVGSLNFKFEPARGVTKLIDGDVIRFETLANLIKDSGIEVVKRVERSREPAANAVFMPFVNTPANANKVADKCRQMGMMRETRGNMSEPVWYAGIELLYHCNDGENLCHEWSKGHASYSAEETDRKIEQIKSLGPTTCATFEGRNPVGCSGCPHRGKITSPIQLGTEREEITTVPPDRIELVPASDAGVAKLESDVFIHPPRPFKRTVDGVVMVNEDGIEVLVYPYDIWLHEIAYDPIERYEIAVVRHWLPQEGWKEFTFRSADVSSEKDFEKSMRDNHIKPLSTKGLLLYFKMYMSTVQHAKQMRLLHSSMGWKGDSFVLGRTEYLPDGRDRAVGVAQSIGTVVNGIAVSGSIEAWRKATEVLGRPGMEAHAFLFACGAAAPLMKFTGFECALVNAVGPTNSGKTSMARFFMSMYGSFDELKLRQRDTTNAKIARLGLMGSLPVYIDEITNTDPDELSELVYEFTQGRSKLRLRQDGTERETYLWNTIVVSTSNSSLLAKLSSAKSNPEAERMRIVEFKVDANPEFQQLVATGLKRKLDANYGIAGQVYVKYVVEHQESIKRFIDAAIELLQQQHKTLPEERMRVAVIACAMVALATMRRLNLIAFDETPVAKWALQQLTRMRLLDRSYRISPLDVLGLYVNETAPNRVIVTRVSVAGREDKFVVVRHAQGAILSRFETNTNSLWLDLRHFRAWCATRQEDPEEIITRYAQDKIVRKITRKSLGAGADIATSAITVMEIDMTHNLLGGVRAAIINPKVSHGTDQAANG